jgi:hypothetical protein
LSNVFDEYKDALKTATKLYYDGIDDDTINRAIDYSIRKRYKEHKVTIDNNYKKQKQEVTILKLCDYIKRRKPIVTAYGVLFERHGDVLNPLAEIIQSFLDQRSIHKAEMLKYPRHSEMFEKYNLLQSLDKRDANSIYGTLGQYTSLIYNKNIATSITAQGRSFISTAGMFFEQFLADNIKFANLNEIVMFIEHTISERPKRKYKDEDIISHWISPEECFTKLIMDGGNCGATMYIPDEDEMEIVWKMVNNLDQEDRNRVYYKNNLYEFLLNDSMVKSIRYMVSILKEPFLTPEKIPSELEAPLNEFCSLLDEYVMNHFQVMDRIVRWQSTIKSVCVISDTDSAIVSLDAWVRFATKIVSDMDLTINRIETKLNPIIDMKSDKIPEDYVFRYIEPEYDFDFYNDEVIEKKRAIDPLTIIPQDNLRYSLINIMSFVVSNLCNDYIEADTKNINSWQEGKKCKMYLKNEFLMKRILLTYVKKNYASILELQEGKIVPQTMENSLDVKGMEAFVKSTRPESTRNALKEILYKDILKSPEIDQIKILKDLAIFEKKIIQSLYDGSKEYYKPATVRALSAYSDPLRIQGIKAIMAWNALKPDDVSAIDLNDRNAVSIAKVILNTSMVEKLKDKNPILYEKAKVLLASPEFKGKCDTIAIPLDVQVPSWVLDILDFDSIINDNLTGFPLKSINIRVPNDNINYINILKL